MAITKAMRKIEQERGQPIAEILKALFVRFGTGAAVAEELGIDPSTLTIWLIRLNLEQATILRERVP